MKRKDGTERIVDRNQAMWVKMPRTGKVVKTLNRYGVAHIKGQNPEFSGATYCVYLGVHERGAPLRFGTLDSHKEGDYFYAEVQQKGSFDIHLKAQSLSRQEVTIEWWAIPESWTCALMIGPRTLGPTPIPTMPPIGLTSIRYKSSDFPGRHVGEVPGVGRAFIQRLTRGKIKNLATLASADAECVAQILRISEVRAMAFIYEARLLLEKTGK